MNYNNIITNLVSGTDDDGIVESIIKDIFDEASVEAERVKDTFTEAFEMLTIPDLETKRVVFDRVRYAYLKAGLNMWDAAAMITLVGHLHKVSIYTADQFVVDALANDVKISDLAVYFNWED